MTAEDLVDKPWGYVVAFSSLLAQAIVGGYAFSSGIYYELFSDVFENSNPVLVSLMSSLPLCTWFIGCPIGSAVLNRWSVRVCCVFGGLVAFLGLFVCYFSNEFSIILIFYGIISGLGHGIMYTGFQTAVNRYIQKRLTSITTITTLGASLGMPVYSFLIPYFSEHYSMRGTFLLLSGLSLNICVCACTIFPLSRRNHGNKKRTIGINGKLITRNLYFSLFNLQCIFCNVSNLLLLIHLPAFILSHGYSEYDASLALTVYGICNCAGKVTSSIVSYFKEVDVVLCYTIALSIYGVCVILVGPAQSLYWILAICALAGFCFCVTGGYNFLTIQELVGQDDFPDGVGFCFLSKSIGVLLAGPIAGFLFNASGSYEITFYVSGSVMLIGCLLMIPVCTRQIRQTKEAGTKDDLVSAPLRGSRAPVIQQ